MSTGYLLNIGAYGPKEVKHLAHNFYNPYNFVNTPDRAKVLTDPFLGDHDPSLYDNRENHSRYWKERYSGTISVHLRTQTPLFITDPESKKETGQCKEHYIYDCLSEIPATALKGMLSSAYEIITNSRYRIFSKKQHEQILGYRSQSNATLVPGRVTYNDGQWKLELFTGTSRITTNGAEGPLYAAWLPAYNRTCETQECKKLFNGKFYENVVLQLYDHGNFKFWSVEKIDGITFTPITRNAITLGERKTVSGYVVKSGKIFNRKHDERFFFNEGVECKKISLTKEAVDRYNALLKDYHRVHADDANQPINGEAVLGKHTEKCGQLKDGDFVYVRTNGSNVQALYPVQISRLLNEKAPWDCLDDSLKPPVAIKELSPADRLFGWVKQSGSGAWKGKLRISSGVYAKKENDPEDPVCRFKEPMALSILGAPKPSQFRFYLGDKDGCPQSKGISKEKASYTEGKKLRGRKVYLHHTLGHLTKSEKECYWDETEGKKMSPLPEYRQPDGKAKISNQNRSITGWIPKGRDFDFSIQAENLTAEELGGLLSLLSLSEEQCYFRLGFAKPLGLGSVRLSINWGTEGIAVDFGASRAERYKSLEETACGRLTKGKARRLIQEYQKAMARLYGLRSETVSEADGLPEEADWKKLDCVEDLNYEQKAAFEQAWGSALDNGDKEPPLASIPERDVIIECYPDAENKLSACYKAALDAREKSDKNDFGWRKIPFIEAFMISMKGFYDNTPVTYPRNAKTREEEGFNWFVENEKMESGRPKEARPLPDIKEPMSGF